MDRPTARPAGTCPPRNHSDHGSDVAIPGRCGSRRWPMTEHELPTAHWMNRAWRVEGLDGVIALRGSLDRDGGIEFNLLLDTPAARRMVMVLTRLLMDQDGGSSV